MGSVWLLEDSSTDLTKENWVLIENIENADKAGQENIVITEQDLIELGFEETTSYNDSITSNVDGYFVKKKCLKFYTLMIDELEFSSNNSDGQDNELEVTITDNQ